MKFTKPSHAHRSRDSCGGFRVYQQGPVLLVTGPLAAQREEGVETDIQGTSDLSKVQAKLDLFRQVSPRGQGYIESEPSRVRM